MASNTAAWLTEAKASPLQIKPAPYPSPRENEIVVKNGAVAINPADRMVQELGGDLFSWISYPCVLGGDLAGEVVEVGSGISRFQVGDRVVGLSLSIMNKRASEGAFQNYTIVLDQLASAIPDTLSYENAAVLPLGLCTAAAGLFEKEWLGLQHPSVNPEPIGKSLIVWGGASSVGSNAIQLAVAAGYDVITTASPKNFDYVKKLGASQVVDYNRKSIVDDLVTAVGNKTLAGALDSIGSNGAFEACADVLLQSNGRKFIASAQILPEKIPDGIDAKFIQSTNIKDNEVSWAVFADFLPKALAQGKYIAAPDPQIIGKGLENIQVAFEEQKKGVSAKKLVVLL